MHGGAREGAQGDRILRRGDLGDLRAALCVMGERGAPPGPQAVQRGAQDGPVLAVHERHDPRVPGRLEHVDELASAGPEVGAGHEDLVAGLTQRRELRHHLRELRRGRPARRVEEDVADGHPADLPEPAPHRVDRGLLALRVREGADGGDASRRRGLGPGRQVIDEVALEMGVGIDPARHHEVAGHVHDPGVASGRQARTDLRDALSDDAHVGLARAVGVHDPAASKEDLGRRLGPDVRGERRGRSLSLRRGPETT